MKEIIIEQPMLNDSLPTLDHNQTNLDNEETIMHHSSEKDALQKVEIIKQKQCLINVNSETLIIYCRKAN